MLHHVCSIYDQGVSAYAPPFIVPSKKDALAEFTRIVNNPQSMIYNRPEDFKLVYLGTFDLSTGKFEPPVNYKFGQKDAGQNDLAHGFEVKKSEETKD